MSSLIKYLFLVMLILFSTPFYAQTSSCKVIGKVTDRSGKVIELAAIKLDQLNICYTNKYGEFKFSIKKNTVHSLSTQHLSYETYISQLDPQNKDSLFLTIKLFEKPSSLPLIEVTSVNKPETLVGKPIYSIYDFDFYEDKLILLTSHNELKRSEIRLTDYSGNEFMNLPIPQFAGEAKKFFHDYLGYTNILCTDTILRIDISDEFFTIEGISKDEYELVLRPVNDTANGNLYYNDQHPSYPSFNYFFFHKIYPKDHKLLMNVTDAYLMDQYNFEYYFLKPREQLEARRIAAEYKVDKHVVAALMSGFTCSKFYEPLYAPLFVLGDTICLFDHVNDRIFHFDKENALIDSVTINYHHPKNWRTWKKQLYVDDAENKVYALYKNGPNVSLKLIDHQTGKIKGVHKFVNISADKIKIKDGYAYYTYRPFESTQERFLYREVIKLVQE